MNWNDDRLDRLADDVVALRAQMETMSRHMDERFEKQERWIADRFDRLQNSMIITLAGVIASVVVPSVF